MLILSCRDRLHADGREQRAVLHDRHQLTDVVTATLPLLTLKEVNLDVNIIEGAGATKANTKITIDPVSVTLAGDSSLLAGMNKIILATIDLTDFSSTFTETYTIPMNNELKTPPASRRRRSQSNSRP